MTTEPWAKEFRKVFTRDNEWLIDASPLDIEAFIRFQRHQLIDEWVGKIEEMKMKYGFMPLGIKHSLKSPIY